ncbi:MAG: AraC family transcriptional regulator [Prevotella sp.]|nr:AraC family transcriptional regulator [Prevotella sp.]
MKQTVYPFILCTLLTLAGCMGKSPQTAEEDMQSQDTTYTEQAVMTVYDYDPVRALQIVDSAVIVGNLSPVRGDLVRAIVYSKTLAGARLDSFLQRQDVGGRPFREGVRFDSARVLGERLLAYDSIRADLAFGQDVLEILVGAARQHKDTLLWLQWAQQLVEVCHRQGDEAKPEALRTEAEVGAVLCRMGQYEQGMARLDSVLAIFESHEQWQFNWLDAYVVTSKRKLRAMSDAGRDLEALPLALRVIERLDDYEQHPQDYHDGSYHEPKDDTDRDDYIRFYRSQIQAFITAVHASLGHQGSVEDTYQQIERNILDATAREHLTRYRALEQQMLRQQAESRSQMMAFAAIASVSGLLVILLFATYVYFQNRRIKQKNQVLIRQINQSLSKEAAMPREQEMGSSGDADNTAALFATIDRCIRSERLFANANIQRQDVCDRFNIRREVLNQLLASHTDGMSFPAYINSIRLSEVCRLLKDEPTKTVGAIADEVGLSPRYLRRLFVEQYGVTPTEFREQREQS